MSNEWRDNDPFEDAMRIAEDAMRIANQHTEDVLAIDGLVGRADAPDWRCGACHMSNSAEVNACGACGEDRPEASV